MNDIRARCLVVAASTLIGQVASAQHSIVDSDLVDAYYVVDHYEILIERPPADVWPHLLDLRSWMSGVDMVHVEGPRSGEGMVLRVYEGEDFFFEITKLIPRRLILGVNLPSLMEGEESVGIGMFTLTEVDGKTLVSNFMSRHYSWFRDVPNPMRETRESDEFLEFTQTMHNTALARLKDLVEED